MIMPLLDRLISFIDLMVVVSMSGLFSILLRKSSNVLLLLLNTLLWVL